MCDGRSGRLRAGSGQGRRTCVVRGRGSGGRGVCERRGKGQGAEMVRKRALVQAVGRRGGRAVGEDNGDGFADGNERVGENRAE